MRNLNYLVHIEGAEDRFVLRIYVRDPAACRKELDLHRLVSPSIPVPEIVYANPVGESDLGPHMLKRYVEGATFQEIKSKGNMQDVAEAAYAIGATLAGFQTALPSITRESAATPIAENLEKSLASPILERRLGVPARDELRDFVSGWLPQLTPMDQENSLVHGDFGARNTIVKRSGDRWVVSGVLDWELAFSGSPLWDAARFICYERRARPLREPHFTKGFSENGGSVPHNWPEFARVINAIGAAESLSRADLPEAFIPELKNLIISTVAGCDPN